MFVNTLGPGQTFSMPDMNKDLTSGLPIPCPNTAMKATAAPSSPRVLICGAGPIGHGGGSTISLGNQPTGGGLVSGVICGPSSALKASNKVFGTSPWSRFPDPFSQNGMNSVGMSLIPDQVKVSVLS